MFQAVLKAGQRGWRVTRKQERLAERLSMQSLLFYSTSTEWLLHSRCWARALLADRISFPWGPQGETDRQGALT